MTKKTPDKKKRKTYPMLRTGPRWVGDELYLSAGDLLKLDLIEHKMMLSRQGTALAKAELEKFLLTLTKDQQKQFVQIQDQISQCRQIERVQAEASKLARGDLSKVYDVDFNSPGFTFDDETGQIRMDGGALFKE